MRHENHSEKIQTYFVPDEKVFPFIVFRFGEKTGMKCGVCLQKLRGDLVALPGDDAGIRLL